MITNQDITIFNLRLDKKTRREVFIPTNISEVSFVDMRSSGGSASEREENLHFTMKQKLPGSQKSANYPLKLLIAYFELNW